MTTIFEDSLDRERLIDNLVDRLFSLEERVRVLETELAKLSNAEIRIPEPETGKMFTPIVRRLDPPRGYVMFLRRVR